MEWIPAIGTWSVAVSDAHRFGTDALVLSDFASPKRGDRILELGTGCGVIALRLCASGKPATVHGMDIAPTAIELATASAAAFAAAGGVPVPAFFVQDWAAPLPSSWHGSYTLAVCNPPYFAPGSGFLSATEADRLARHEQPGTLQAVCGAAAAALQYGGRFCLCHRPERLPAVLAALSAAGLEPKKLRAVQHRPDSAPWLMLMEARKGGNPGLIWLPPLCQTDGNGNDTADWCRIYGGE